MLLSSFAFHKNLQWSVFYASMFRLKTFSNVFIIKLVPLFSFFSFVLCPAIYLSFSISCLLDEQKLHQLFSSIRYCASFNSQLLVQSPLNRKLRENPSRWDWKLQQLLFTRLVTLNRWPIRRAIMLLSDIMKWLCVVRHCLEGSLHCVK